MDKKIGLNTLFLLLFTGLFANQPVANKLDLRTYKRIQSGKVTDEDISLLVRGDLKKIEALTVKLGGHYKYGYNNISSITLPEENLLAFSNEMAVEKIQCPSLSHGTLLMDSARIRNNIDSVQAGISPLPNDLKGRGVLIGIIDGGIYFQHPDFKHADGTTRVRYIWDQQATGSNAPAPYNYGNQWSWIDINSGNCTAVEKYTGNCADFGHGTCVAGIAAGNGSSVKANPNLAGKYTGVAPECDIIAVNIGSGGCYTDKFQTNLSDAVDYIFKKADALGMPCVINTSLGDYYGSHDGIDLTTQLLETLLDQRNGRVIVAAAGNAGDEAFHLSYDISSDSAYTFFKYSPAVPGAYFDWWTDTANFNRAFFAVGCNDSLGNDLGRTDYLSVPVNFNPPPGQGITITINLFGTSSLLGKIDMQVTLDEGRYHCEVLITTSNQKLLWRLQTRGSGKFDLWSSYAHIGSSDMVRTIAGVPIQYPNYRHPDNLKTMVSGWQNSDKVITVGNYSNRTGYLDVDSNFVDLSGSPDFEVPGKRFHTSSFGPTRDNRLKPDIMATGSTTICTGDMNDIGLKLGSPSRFKVGLGGKHERNGGTSMASPLVAGIAALYLEKRPTANYNEIKKALILTATRDEFTTPDANPEYGNGKVNAFDAITYGGFIYGAMDTACINYNALANLDTNGCVAKIYGCTDIKADNYDPLANIDNNTCAYAVSVKNIGNTVSVQVIPNPSTGNLVFKIEGYIGANGTIKIYNQLGALVDELAVTAGRNTCPYQNNKLPKGFYTYSLNSGEQNLRTGKIIIE